jgi:hypothetical protein
MDMQLIEFDILKKSTISNEKEKKLPQRKKRQIWQAHYEFVERCMKLGRFDVSKSDSK